MIRMIQIPRGEDGREAAQQEEGQKPGASRLHVVCPLGCKLLGAAVGFLHSHEFSRFLIPAPSPVLCLLTGGFFQGQRWAGWEQQPENDDVASSCTRTSFRWFVCVWMTLHIEREFHNLWDRNAARVEGDQLSDSAGDGTVSVEVTPE